MLMQRLRLAAAIDADHAAEVPSPTGFDTSQRVLEQDSTRRLNSEAAGGFQKKRRIGLARQPELVRIEPVDTPSASGKGQKIARCPACRIAVWSHYAGAGDAVSFVRVGTLDTPDRVPPDIHIFTASKQPWVVLPDGIPAVAEYYRREEHWPAPSLERRAALLARAPYRW